MSFVRSHKDLKVYQLALSASMEVFEWSRRIPRSETYSLTDQLRRSSRSVVANLAEAYRKRIYPKSFVSKLSDAEAEAAETQVWLEYAVLCGYLEEDVSMSICNSYDHIIGMLVNMRRSPEKWRPE